MNIFSGGIWHQTKKRVRHQLASLRTAIMACLDIYIFIKIFLLQHMASRIERERTVGIFEECNTRLLSTSRDFSSWHLSIQWQHAGELRKERQQLVSLRTAIMPSLQDDSRHFNEIYMAIFLNIYRKSLAVFRTGQCNAM